MKQRLLTAVMLAFILVGCSGKQYLPVSGDGKIIESESESVDIAIETEPIPIVIETEPEEPELPEEPEERIEQDGMIRSYLTGEMVPVGQGNRRPLAIMMSNDKASLPQYGINRAGVVYEAQVEGVMNRYLAIMENYDDLERIGSVRSCRTYYIYFAREFNAIYAHFGQSTFAKPYLKNIENINGIDGVGGTAFFRAKDKKSPHNAYASYTGIQRAIERLGYSQDYNPEYTGHYQFARTGHPVELSGDQVIAAARITPGYQFNEPWFEYHPDDGLYYRYQYGSEHRGDEGQIAVRNIIIQYCPAGYYATTDYRNINVHESVSGFYITGGAAIPVSWVKDGEFGLTHYYDPDGNEITLNQGKTWVCIMTGDMMGKAQIQ